MNQPNFRLLPSLRFTPQISGSRRWYAVEDPQSGRFLKLGPAEYLVASGLQNGVATAQIVQVLEDHGFESPRERVTSTVAWLAKQGLLLTDAPKADPLTSQAMVDPGTCRPTSASQLAASPNTATTNAPSSTSSSKSLKAVAPPAKAAFDPFFIRIPLLSGSVVERIAKPFSAWLSLPVAIVFGLLLLAALSAVMSSDSRIWSLSSKLFVEDGRLWWLVAWLILKCAHELGHAVAAVSTGSRIRSAGLHFIFLAPVPYVDVTDLWSITNRRHRIFVSSAGMLAEMVVAAVAILLAMATDSLAVQYLCAALATLGTITTLAFNGNPLMKFDGYYILSDLLGRPNLWTESQAAAKAAIARVLNPFGERSLAAASSAMDNHGTQLSLTAYGLTTMFYRFVMLITMGWWLLSVWNGVGVIAIAWAVWGWFVRPIWLRRAAARAAFAAGRVNPEVEARGSRSARRAYTLAVMGVALLVGLLPSPRGVRAPGVVGYGQPTTVRSGAEGVLTLMQPRDRQLIAEGHLIGRLENPSLLVELADAKLKCQTSVEQANALRARGELALLQAEQAKMESLAEHLEQLETRVQQLEIRAPCSGMVVISSNEQLLGRYVKPGQPVCMIVSPTQLEVCASASQRDATQFSLRRGQTVTVAATGERRCPGKLVSVDSRGSEHCEQQTLAANYGGPLPVELAPNPQGENHYKYPTPRFEIKVDLAATDRPQPWIVGQLVWVHLGERPQRVWQWLAESLYDTLRSRAVQ